MKVTREHKLTLNSSLFGLGMISTVGFGWEIITRSLIWIRFPMSAVRQSAETPSRRQQFRAKLLDILTGIKFTHVSD